MEHGSEKLFLSENLPIEVAELPNTPEEARASILQKLTQAGLITEGENPGYSIFFRFFDKERLSSVQSNGFDRSNNSQVHFEGNEALQEAGLKPEDIIHAGIYGNLMDGNDCMLTRAYGNDNVAIAVYDAEKLDSVRGVPHSCTPKEGESFKSACVLIFTKSS